jgi:endoglucanase
VRVGDVAVIEGEPVELPNDRAVARSMDNRLGCYVAYEAARLVHEAGGRPGDVVAVAAVQEETSFGGSRRRPTRCAPTWPSSSTSPTPPTRPASRSTSWARIPFGSGPVIERGSNLNPRVVELLYETAEAEAIPFTVQASARHTGTDVDAMHLARGGIPCGGIGLPLRYMHSPVEMVQLDDIANAASSSRRRRSA